MEKSLFRPKSFTLQWHVTERCNWRCTHCYQEDYTTPEMNLQEMEDVLNQYVALIKKWRLSKRQAKIQITGGEPFIRKNFLSFLKMIHQRSKYFHWTIMSNGSLLTKDIVKELKFLGIQRLQLSLEGLEKTNDKIRGKGSFQKIFKAIKLLDWAGIPIGISLTLSKQNYQEIKELAKILASLNVRKITLSIRRIAPFGLGGSCLKNFLLEPLQLQELYREIEKINIEMMRTKKRSYFFKVTAGCESAIFNDEISQRGLMNYGSCGILDGRMITLMPNGDILICRRCPIKIGNTHKKSLEQIYYSPLYENLRKKEDVPLECYTCSNLKSCFGGAKCVTYATTGKTSPDIQCWKLFTNLDEATNYIKSPRLFQKIKLITKNLKKNFKFKR